MSVFNSFQRLPAISTLLFFSIFNIPLMQIGDNAIGIFDVISLIFILIYFFPFKPIAFTSIVFLFFLFASILLTTSIINSFLGNNITSSSILYVAKLYQVSLTGYIVTKIISKDKLAYSSFDQLIFSLISLLFVYNLFQVFVLGWFRSGVPFVVGSSGPLGLLASCSLIYGLSRPRSKLPILIVILSLLILVFALSKSFLICVPFLIFAQIKKPLAFRNIYILLLLSVSTWSILLFDNPLSKLIKILYNSAVNFSELSSLSFRVSRHWFVNFTAHYESDFLFFFGGGAQSISISYDSLYFYLFYTVGILGSLVLFSFCISRVRHDKIFRSYFIVMIVSGIFLETSLISYRGIEPSLILLSLASIMQRNLPSLRNI